MKHPSFLPSSLLSAALAAILLPLSSFAYTIHFNANGGDGVMPDQMVQSNEPGVLNDNAFTHTNGFFLGWALSADGYATLLDGDSTDDISVGEGGEITLYAKWMDDIEMDSLEARHTFSGNYYDESGNNHTLVNHGTTWTIDRFGYENGAVESKGQRTYLSNGDFTLSSSFSIACWIKTSVAKDYETGSKVWAYGNYPIYPRCEGSSSMAGIGFKAGTDGVSVVEHASGYQPVALSWTGAISSGWNHICVVVESNTTATIFVNGEQKATGALSSRNKTFGLDGGVAGTGGDWGHYTGALDDLCVFSRALTAGEITAVMRGKQSTYAVRFDSNGGEGTMPKRVFASGDDAAIPAAIFTRTGHTFVGWATSADGPLVYMDGETVEDGFNVENGETVTLYARWSEGSYTVHFDANGGTGTMPDQTLWLGIPGNLDGNEFSCNDLAFAGWVAQPDGSPVYEDEADVTNLAAAGESITLYAVWAVPHGLKAKYYDISSISDSDWYQQVDTYEECTAYHEAKTPTIVTNTVDLGDALDFGDNNNTGTAYFHGKYAQKGTENFVLYLKGVITCSETGTYSFNVSHDDGCVVYCDGISAYSKSAATSGWNTFSVDLSAGYHEIVAAMHEGGGGQRLQFQMKSPGDAAWSPLPQSVLYATNPYILTFDADGGSGGSTITNIYGAAVAPPSDPTRTGYTFAGWEPTIPATMPASNVTCRALWTPIRYTVRFNANGGTGEMAEIGLSYDETTALPAVAFSRENRVFAGWATSQDGAVAHTDGATVSNLTATADESVTLYAVWADALVTFNANGGEGTMDSFPVYLGTVQTLPPCAFFETNAFFLGWATSPNGEATLLGGDSTENIVVAQGGTMTLYAVWEPWQLPLYMVVDLSDGSSAMSYPVTCLDDAPNGGFNTDEYKTTKLALRRIAPAEFLMGGLYKTTLTRPYYIGVFEVTQKQYELVAGNNPSSYKGDMRPVDCVTWPMFRGDPAVYDWPYMTGVAPDSFVGRLQARTELNFDLPTEAQWEYACRAGTTSAYNNGGDTEADLNLLGRYPGNEADGAGGYSVKHTAAGTYIPNAWGLYDMHGNVSEYCIDWYGPLVNNSINPIGVSFGTNKVLRGGSYYNSANSCTSSYRLGKGTNPSGKWINCGYRLALTSSVPPTYAVRFDANGGEGTMPKRVFASGDDAVLPAATFTRNGCTFVGWATSVDGPVVYADGEIVASGFNAANGETVTLYALWSQGTYSVQFDANGGFGTMPDQTLWLDVAQPLATNAFVRDGFAFVGWATAPDSQPLYADGADFRHTGESGDTVTLYAAWTLAPGLAVRYYDIASDGYSTWIQSESAMMAYFAVQTPTIETNTLAFGETLDAGFTSLNPDSSLQSRWRSIGLTIPQNGCRFHGKYSIDSTKGFSALITGLLKIDESGLYEFATLADDVVVIFVDGQFVLANGETWETATTGQAELSAGLHSITIAYREQDQAGGQGISVQLRRAGESTYVPIPQSSLWHAPDSEESADAAVLWGAVDVESPLGSPDPGGRFDAPWDETVELSMPEPLVVDPDDPGVRLSCAGWVGTGSVPATGTETNVSFVLRECSTLTWLWETNSVLVSLTVEGDAEASGENEGWFAFGTDAVLSFAPTSAVAVVCELSGDAEGVIADAGLRAVTIPADRPRAVMVRVRAMMPADSLETGMAGVWSGVGGGIEAAGGWHLAPDATAADGYSLRSDETAGGDTATVELAVPLAGTLTFDWRVLTTARRHYARFYVDGVRQRQITGETDWATETISLGDGAHVLRWTYEKSTAAASGQDAAFLDNVHWEPLTLASALDATNVVWSTEGGAEWIPQVSVSSDGESAARSGALVGEETSRLIASVRGAGTFAWSWKADIGGVAGVDVWLDGEWLEDVWLDSDVADWEEMSLDIAGNGSHEIVFAFWNGGGADDIGDSAYIDAVSWSGQEERTLIVESEYGAASPAVGTHVLGSGDAVAASVAASAPENGTRRVCTGWTGTGSVPASGTGTNVTFTLQEDSTLAWNWRTEYWTQIEVTGGTCDFTARWVAEGMQIEVEIAPTPHLYSISLSGDITGATLDDTTLRIAADRPRTIQVVVKEETPAEVEIPDISGEGALSFGTDGSGNPTFNVRVSNPVPGIYYTAFVADTLSDTFRAEASSHCAEAGEETILFTIAAGDGHPSRFVRIVASTTPFAAGDPFPEDATRR